MRRLLRGIDDLVIEVFAIGVSAIVVIALAKQGLNSATAQRADSLPIVGTLVSGGRALVNSI